MKKKKIQFLHKVFALLGIVVLVLPTALPATTVFAEGVNVTVNSSDQVQNEKITSDTDSSDVGNPASIEQSSPQKNDVPAAPVQSTDNGKEKSEAPAAPEPNSQDSEEEGEGDDDPDPEPETEETTKSTTEDTEIDNEEEPKFELFNVGPQRDLQIQSLSTY